jgi:hypothetical protein
MPNRRQRLTRIVRRDPLFDKTCPTCGRTFAGLKRQTYCSINCANKASYWRHAERRRAERRTKYRRQKQETEGQR